MHRAGIALGSVAIAVFGLGLGACASSAAKSATVVESTTVAQPAPTTTIETPPVGVALQAGWKLLAQGQDSGVRWFFSQGRDPDPSMGTCRALDSDPPLQTGGAAPRRGLPDLLGASARECSRLALKVPTDPEDVLDGSPTVDLVRLNKSVNGDFSAVAGVTAAGVESVTLHYADGSESVVHPSTANVFVAISRPARPNLSWFTAQWSGGRVTCTDADIGPNFGCTYSA